MMSGNLDVSNAKLSSTTIKGNLVSFSWSGWSIDLACVGGNGQYNCANCLAISTCASWIPSSDKRDIANIIPAGWAGWECASTTS